MSWKETPYLTARRSWPPKAVSGVFMARSLSFWGPLWGKVHFPKVMTMRLLGASYPAAPHPCVQPGLIHVELAKLSGLCAALLGYTSRANLHSQDRFLNGLYLMPGPSYFHAFSGYKSASKTPRVMFWGNSINQALVHQPLGDQFMAGPENSICWVSVRTGRTCWVLQAQRLVLCSLYSVTPSLTFPKSRSSKLSRPQSQGKDSLWRQFCYCEKNTELRISRTEYKRRFHLSDSWTHIK